MLQYALLKFAGFLKVENVGWAASMGVSTHGGFGRTSLFQVDVWLEVGWRLDGRLMSADRISRVNTYVL